MPRTRLIRTILGALFLIAASYQAVSSVDSVGRFMNRDETARAPFSFVRLSGVISSVRPEAERAGLKPGDRVVSVQGQEYKGEADLAVPLAASRPGESLAVGLAGGTTALVVLSAVDETRAGLIDWFVFIVIQIAMPWLCLLLGFWVAALRSEDPLAWILLFLMMSFSHLNGANITHWSGWIRAPGIAYRNLFIATWPIWMMMFGIYFPDRAAIDRRVPWIKWTFVILISFWAVIEVALKVGAAENFQAILGFDSLVRPLEVPLRIVYMAVISIFFLCLGMKMGMTRDPDSRRRLILLNVGTSLSLMPSFMLALRSLILKVPFFSGVPRAILIPAILMMFLFPLTLAYVIVVHRALDVRVVLRQGVQYALATRGVAVLQGITILTVITVMFTLLSRPDVRRVEVLGVVSGGLLLTVLIGRVAERLRQWIDRRFFREAYDAERILSDLSEQVRTIVETGPLLETVARRISESLHIERVVFMVEEMGAFRPAYAIGSAGDPHTGIDSGSSLVARLRETSAPARVRFDDPKSWVNRPEAISSGDREALESMRTELLLPLSARDKLLGIVSLGSKRSDEPYTGGDLRVLRSLAAQTGLALENSRLTTAIATEVAIRERHSREVEIAREVQQRLFPQRLPPIDGLAYQGHCRPALGVGGDYFDFLALPGGRLGIAIADVSGKGIGAALLMASLQASLRGQTLRANGSLAQVMETVNGLVYDASPENRYATFFYAEYDPMTREMTYVNAGHCHPILLRRDRGGVLEVIRLKTGGTVIGLFEKSRYVETKIALRPGDLIVAFTDGLSEALNPQEEEWGEQQVIDLAATCDDLPVDATIDTLIRGADTFAAGAPQYDDMTVVVLRVISSGPAVK